MSRPAVPDARPAARAAGWATDRFALARELLVASRPLSWINTALPFLAAAYDVGRGLDWLLLIGTLYFLVPYNLLMYGVNDIFDYASDLANPRKRSIEGGLVPPDRRGRTWIAIAVTNLPFLALLALAAPAAGAAAVAVAAFAALAYSAPPLRTKVRPFADSLTSASHFVLPAAAGFLVAGRGFGDLPWLALAAFTAWGVASHALGAIQDVEYDRAAGIGSIATSIGARATAAVSLVGYALAVLGAATYGGLALAGAAVLATYLLLPLAILGRPTEGQARRAWRSFLGLNLLVGFVLTQLLLRHWGIVAATPAQLAAGTAASLVGVVLLQLLANAWTLRRSRRPPLAGPRVSPPLPRLTVVVPCRDEATRLPALLAALAMQDHPDLEVIVVDDGSSDGSAGVARMALARLAPRIPLARVVEAARPAGWAGKSWACDRGAKLASGDHVLFLDADTIPVPGALTTLHEVAVDGGAGLVSGVTRYDMPTAAERALVPGFPMAVFGLLPLWASSLAGGRSRRLAFAYGPLLLVDRAAYEASGGHAATPASQREDLDLAKTMAGAGLVVRTIAAADLATTRHYPGGRGALAAWRRVALAYGGGSFAVLLLLLAVEAGAWLLPLLVPLAGLLTGDPTLLGGGAVSLALLVAFRLCLAALDREPLTAILWHPVTAVATIAAQLASLADGVRGVPPIWRGRSYETETP